MKIRHPMTLRWDGNGLSHGTSYVVKIGPYSGRALLLGTSRMANRLSCGANGVHK